MDEKEKAWKTVSSKYLFRRPWLTVRCEDMLLPNGNHIPEYYILEYPDWVNTIAITKEGKFVFVRQYRPGVVVQGKSREILSLQDLTDRGLVV